LRNTDASNESGVSYRRYLLQESGYLTTIIRKMEDALGIHEVNDQEAGAVVKQADQGPI
jgi:hypothetical protein